MTGACDPWPLVDCRELEIEHFHLCFRPQASSFKTQVQPAHGPPMVCGHKIHMHCLPNFNISAIDHRPSLLLAIGLALCFSAAASGDRMPRPYCLLNFDGSVVQSSVLLAIGLGLYFCAALQLQICFSSCRPTPTLIADVDIDFRMQNALRRLGDRGTP